MLITAFSEAVENHLGYLNLYSDLQSYLNRTSYCKGTSTIVNKPKVTPHKLHVHVLL